MATHKDAVKRARQAEEARVRNKSYRSRMRNELRKLNEAIESGKHAAAEAQLRETVSVIQRVAQKGVIHARQATRRVSRLTNQVNALRASK